MRCHSCCPGVHDWNSAPIWMQIFRASMLLASGGTLGLLRLCRTDAESPLFEVLSATIKRIRYWLFISYDAQWFKTNMYEFFNWNHPAWSKLVKYKYFPSNILDHIWNFHNKTASLLYLLACCSFVLCLSTDIRITCYGYFICIDNKWLNKEINVSVMNLCSDAQCAGRKIPNYFH